MISPGEMMKILATEAAKVAAGCAAPAGSEVLLPYQKRWISDANLMRRMMASREFGRRIAALWYPPNDKLSHGGDNEQ